MYKIDDPIRPILQAGADNITKFGKGVEIAINPQQYVKDTIKRKVLKIITKGYKPRRDN